METSPKYADIMDMPRHISSRHPPMSMLDRAAQFAPFAALTGLEGVIDETGRLTQGAVELTEAEQLLLDEKLQRIRERLQDRPEITVTWFQPDARKQGGAYVTARGHVQKLDLYRRTLLIADRWIPIDAIYTIEGEIFGEMEDLGGR